MGKSRRPVTDAKAVASANKKQHKNPDPPRVGVEANPTTAATGRRESTNVKLANRPSGPAEASATPPSPSKATSVETPAAVGTTPTRRRRFPYKRTIYVTAAIVTILVTPLALARDFFDWGYSTHSPGTVHPGGATMSSGPSLNSQVSPPSGGTSPPRGAKPSGSPSGPRGVRSIEVTAPASLTLPRTTVNFVASDPGFDLSAEYAFLAFQNAEGGSWNVRACSPGTVIRCNSIQFGDSSNPPGRWNVTILVVDKAGAEIFKFGKVNRVRFFWSDCLRGDGLVPVERVVDA